MNSNFLYEIKNGKGFIKEYKRNNHLIFEGTYLNGKGKGKVLYKFNFRRRIFI